MEIKVLYRISDGGNPKVKLANATKKACLENAVTVFGANNLVLFADNCGQATIEMTENLGLKPNKISLGNAMSWRHVAQYAMDNMPDNQIVYLLEDDYFHKKKSPILIAEALHFADYATLYDHPDKYLGVESGGPNPYVKNGAEVTKLWLSKNGHWKQTNSTTMTFAAKVKTLREDWPIWLEFTSKGFPNDFGAFQRLQGLGNWENRIFGKSRVLVSSIPGHSTHVETNWLSPLTDWAGF